jgi:hypothetical protein
MPGETIGNEGLDVNREVSHYLGASHPCELRRLSTPVRQLATIN